MKNVPQIVKDAAHDLIIMYGDAIDYLGKYEGADAYMYRGIMRIDNKLFNVGFTDIFNK